MARYSPPRIARVTFAHRQSRITMLIARPAVGQSPKCSDRHKKVLTRAYDSRRRVEIPTRAGREKHRGWTLDGAGTSC